MGVVTRSAPGYVSGSANQWDLMGLMRLTHWSHVSHNSHRFAAPSMSPSPTQCPYALPFPLVLARSRRSHSFAALTTLPPLTRVQPCLTCLGRLSIATGWRPG